MYRSLEPLEERSHLLWVASMMERSDSTDQTIAKSRVQAFAGRARSKVRSATPSPSATNVEAGLTRASFGAIVRGQVEATGGNPARPADFAFRPEADLQVMKRSQASTAASLRANGAIEPPGRVKKCYAFLRPAHHGVEMCCIPSLDGMEIVSNRNTASAPIVAASRAGGVRRPSDRHSQSCARCRKGGFYVLGIGIHGRRRYEHHRVFSQWKLANRSPLGCSIRARRCSGLRAPTT
jgi:hypothetical protein